MDERLVNTPGKPPEDPQETESGPDGLGALHLLENSAYAPKCPEGHGALTLSSDESSLTGTSLSCPQCGARRELEVTMLRGLLSDSTAHLNVPLAYTGQAAESEQTTDQHTQNIEQHTDDAEQQTDNAPETEILRQPVSDAEATTEIPLVTAAAADVPPLVTEPIPAPATEVLWKTQPDAVRDPHDTGSFAAVPASPPPPRARGLRPDGTIRTTGWLQAGPYPISSGIWASLAGLVVGAALFGVSLPSLIAAAGAWAVWKIATRWIWPASVVVNQRQVRARELEPGMCVRIYGRIGPAAVIGGVTPVRREQVRLHFTGGSDRVVPATARCQLVELRT